MPLHSRSPALNPVLLAKALDPSPLTIPTTIPVQRWEDEPLRRENLYWRFLDSEPSILCNDRFIQQLDIATLRRKQGAMLPQKQKKPSHRFTSATQLSPTSSIISLRRQPFQSFEAPHLFRPLIVIRTLNSPWM
jgi:hypothetical protein